MTEVTDWIGAVGSAVGAIGTAGALLLGVRVYSRQEKDQRRRQAAAVTVGHRQDKNVMSGPIPRPYVQNRYFIRNDSQLPIYRVLLYAGPPDERKHDIREVLAPGDEASFLMPSTDFPAIAKFVDSAGTAWQRNGSGRLTEITHNLGQPWPMD
ncbi:hypothetical protein [Arthrobacter sp. 2MCAF14]|uniref:hypothetical protein n=1 Tax=Arthrobacter sp. 2MCAF14 TaxID=3232982 RepID=UPI003F8FA49D